ncbi:predicted protein [Naegleria gruberi]|uniref:Predicted protein n=1 Tax=Naegleria gruberi TaxID=5762 RepID=D2UYV3_NAEGR|nr:uncharacterized protein NAEGRDRAFT_61714 [Naegleria gruberi]EFC50035.1 predicted protein [Naegleria gruberi]|eukprot:XP_002682779.1 predicted protein [Naegleria gruberi strain NEG-M]
MTNNTTTATNNSNNNGAPINSSQPPPTNGNSIIVNSIILSERKNPPIITATIGATGSSGNIVNNSSTKIVELGVEESSPSMSNPSIPQQVAHAVVNSIVNSNTVTSNRRIHSFKNTTIQRIIDLESNLIALSDRTIFGNRSDIILEEEITYNYLKDYYYNNDQPISIDGQDELPINKKIEPYSPSFSYSFKEDQRARMLFFFSLLISCCLCLIPPFMMFSSVPCCVMYWCTDLVKFKSRRAKIYATLLYYLSVTFSLVCFIIFIIIIPLSLVSALK